MNFEIFYESMISIVYGRLSTCSGSCNHATAALAISVTYWVHFCNVFVQILRSNVSRHASSIPHIFNCFLNISFTESQWCTNKIKPSLYSCRSRRAQISFIYLHLELSLSRPSCTSSFAESRAHSFRDLIGPGTRTVSDYSDCLQHAFDTRLVSCSDLYCPADRPEEAAQLA